MHIHNAWDPIYVRFSRGTIHSTAMVESNEQVIYKDVTGSVGRLPRKCEQQHVEGSVSSHNFISGNECVEEI